MLVHVKNSDLKACDAVVRVTQMFEGALRTHGKHLRITPSRVQTDDGFNARFRAFNEAFADVLDVPRRIARDIASQLKLVRALRNVRVAPKVTDSGAANMAFVEARSHPFMADRHNEKGKSAFADSPLRYETRQ